ncbi:UNVERIFIED_CONTAM: hypothetical protein RMT77_011781 [Armadillidium vulgare]
MDQENNENVDTLYLNYDLSEGLLYHDGVELKSLRKLSILTAVVDVLNCDEAVEEIRNLYLGDNPENFNLDSVVRNILGIDILPPPLKIEFEVAIRFVSMEILSFLSSFCDEDMPLFFGNFVFNWQGVINNRKTVQKVLRSSNSLSLKRKFAFSCVYVFDRDLITDLYNLLPLENVFSDWFPNNCRLFEALIFYWIVRISKPHQTLPIELQQRANQQISNSTFFLSYLDSPYCTEIGAQFLFEHLSLPNSIIHQAIGKLLFDPRFQKFNISMYLMFQLRECEVFNRFSYEILTNLLTNPRWHDCFLRYFRILMHEVEKDRFVKLVNTAISEMALMTGLEGKYGKSFSILKDFIILILKLRKQYMERTQTKEYARAVFKLYKFQDVVLITILLFTNEEDFINIGNKF